MTSPDFYHVVPLQQLTWYEQRVYWEVQAGCHIQQMIVIQEVKDRFCSSHHTYLSNGSQRSYDSLFSVTGNSSLACSLRLLLQNLPCTMNYCWLICFANTINYDFFHTFSSDECFTYSFVCIICDFNTLLSTGIIHGHL